MALVACEIKGVFVAKGEGATAPVVLLSDKTGRKLPIFIGIWEAISINSALQKEVLPRPFTHDLFIELLDRFTITLTSLKIDSIQDGVYYAQLVMNDETNEELIDCRPSDGIAIAVRAGVPVFVEETVLDEAGTRDMILPELVELASILQK